MVALENATHPEVIVRNADNHASASATPCGHSRPCFKTSQDFFLAIRILAPTARLYMLRSLAPVSAATLLGYDYLLTFGREVNLTWANSWGPVEYLFFAARYSPFLDVSLNLYHIVSPTIGGAACRSTYILQEVILVLGILACEAILLIRAWALWDRNKVLGGFLFICFVGAMVSSLAIQAIWIKSMKFAFEATRFSGPRCGILSGDFKSVLSSFAIIIFLESLVILLTMTKLAKQCYVLGSRHFFAGIVGVLLRDGLFFFICLFGISVANMLVVWSGSDALIPMQRVLHSILGVRFLFHLREAQLQDSDNAALTSVCQTNLFTMTDVEA